MTGELHSHHLSTSHLTADEKYEAALGGEGKAQEEGATCHSPLMHLSPLPCGRLTPTQKPLFSLGTRAQVAGGGKVELPRWLSQLRSSRSQGEDTLSLTGNAY
ncbi:unnamed protein product [Pleuronectes platessa]|uniref:Uncharacterized protein n=1 Tax=Pleuronectes platessa TaxID=8262 RepID=A0A9N7YJA2_PLEPL|nr:unnamed protein product [Pleuronectes platessa]